MELTKSNFIKTDIGYLPSDWSCVKVNSVSDLLHGHQFLTTDFTKSAIGVKVVKIGNVNFGQLYLENCDLVNHELANRYSKFIISNGDIVMSLTGNIGRVARVRDIKELVLQNYRVGRFIPRKIDPGFLTISLSSVQTLKQMQNLANAAAQANFGKQDFDKIFIPLPPTLTEQKAIATALSDVDELIAKLEKLIEKKKAIKQGAMQQLLTPPHKGGKRLKGFSGVWAARRLGDLIRFQSGYPLSSSFFNQRNIGTRVIKNRDLKADDSIFYFSSDFPAEYLVKNGDVLIGMDGDFLLCLWNKGPAILNQRVGRLSPIKDVDLIFLYYYLQYFLKEIENRTSSTTVKHLSHNLVEDLALPLPLMHEQEAIALVLFDLDRNLESLSKQLSKTTALKQGMMQELLTGRTRLI